MNRRTFLQRAATAPAAAALIYPGAASPGAQPIPLPKPQKQGGKPFLQAVSERKTSRNLTTEKLSPQQLSNLLWTAFGVNREDGKRTAPTALNVQDIRVYVFLEEGVYLYDAARHMLEPVAEGDQRGRLGAPVEARKAAVNLIYVADYEKYSSSGRGRSFDDSLLTAWSNSHAGFIGQNVYLYAASEGLGAWFQAGLDGAALTRLLRLGPRQKPLYLQTVGVVARG